MENLNKFYLPNEANGPIPSLVGLCFFMAILLCSCQQKPKPENAPHKMEASCSSSLPSRFGIKAASVSDSLGTSLNPVSHQGM
jgi:hypothetical protein